MKVAIIGSGPSAIGAMNGIVDALRQAQEKNRITAEEIAEWRVDIFESSANVGYGGPYDPAMTGAEHLFNGTNVSGFHPGDKEVFFNWLQNPENQDKIDRKFREIFSSRFEDKFKLFFPNEIYRAEAFGGKNILSEGYGDEPECLRLSGVLGPKFENLCNHYIKDHEDIKSRYLKFSLRSEFTPRIAYGIFLNHLFKEKLEGLEQLIGEENVKVHASTKVVGLDADSNLLLESQSVGKKFDIISVGTGRWQPDFNQTETERHIVNAWPISRVEERVTDLIETSKREGKAKVRIAIEGSSLTAVDMSKTILHNCGVGRFEAEGDKLRFIKNEDLGIDVEVDMVSRNGMMSLVRGSFSWTPEQLGKYYVDAIKQVAQERGVDFAEFDSVKFSSENNQVQKSQIRDMNLKLLDNYAHQNPDAKIRLWQIFDSFLEILGTSYELAESSQRDSGKNDEADLLRQKSEKMKGFAAFVRGNQDNYQAIIDLYSQERASDSFRSLQADLDDAIQGDINGDSIFEAVNKHFAGSVYDNVQLLPEEKMLAKKYDSIYTCFDAPMPPQSAKEMIALNEAGVLHVVKNGYDLERKETPASIGWLDEQTGLAGKQYDLAINCTGTRLNFETTQDNLYRTICGQYEVKDRSIILSEAEFGKMRERISGNETFKDIAGKFRNEGGMFVYRMGESEMETINIDTSRNPNAPKIILSRNLVAVSTAFSGAEKAMKDVITEDLAATKIQRAFRQNLSGTVSSTSSQSLVGKGKENEGSR